MEHGGREHARLADQAGARSDRLIQQVAVIPARRPSCQPARLSFGSACTKEWNMTVDRYTKVVLTVIAACLVWLCAGGPSLITPVSAQLRNPRFGSGFERSASDKRELPAQAADPTGDHVILAGWRDQYGVVRPFESPWALPRPEQGALATPGPLPVWNSAQ